MSRIYEFAPLATAPLVRKEAYPYGAIQIISIPDGRIPSPLCKNLAPQTVKDLKEFLTGSGPDGKPGVDNGSEIWETWKRAWDLWNNHYIEGRECPDFILSEYKRLKVLMDKDNERKRRKRPPIGLRGGGGGGGNVGGGGPPRNSVQLIYSRVYSEHRPTTAIAAGHIWVMHRYRTKKKQVPTGAKILQNNPNPIEIQQQVDRVVRRVVQQHAGDRVKVFRQIARNQQGIEIQHLRQNGSWNQTLTSWGNLRDQRRAGTLVAPLDTETTAEHALEPLGTRRVIRPVKITGKHLEHIDVIVEQQTRPLVSWKLLTAERKRGQDPDVKTKDTESLYEPFRPRAWVPNEFDLFDTGKFEVLLHDRTTEVEVVEQTTETVFGNPIVETDLTQEVIFRQWLEIDSPAARAKRNKKAPPKPQGPKPSAPPAPPGDSPPDVTPPPVLPPSSALDAIVSRTKDHPQYQEWEQGLSGRWDAANPTRLASISDQDWIRWRNSKRSEMSQQGANITAHASFQPPAHSNGHPVFRHHDASQIPEQSSDEDMADVSDQEFQEIIDDDDLEMGDYEQRALGGEDVSDVESQESVDIENAPSNSSDDSSSSSDSDKPINLGPPPRGPDGGAAGFFPMKVLPEYLEPNGDEEDWVDSIQNTVWRPKRVGETTLKVDMDEPWENITDLEVDGGLDCGRSPYPVLRPLIKYIRNEYQDGNEPAITFRKEKVWDGVTGSIFNMPTQAEAATVDTLDDREGRIALVYDQKSLGLKPRHNLFPLDIRRCKVVDPATKRPYDSEIRQDLQQGETETDFDLPWNNPERNYPDLPETDPWWVTSEQEQLRDIPPRRHPVAEDGQSKGNIIPADDYRWKEERRLDEDNKAAYFVTNLHGGTLIVNGVEVKTGRVAGPLPEFAYIQTPGGQVSFWWGVGGRYWGDGRVNGNDVASWRQLRRLPGWEHTGLNAGLVWNRMIRDRLVREQSGNDLEDDEQWEKWKKPPPDPNTNGSSNAANYGSTGNNKPVNEVHPPIEICTSGMIKPASSLNVFKVPDLFETDEVELAWLHTRAQPLRDALVGAVRATKSQVMQLRALSSFVDPNPDDHWPGPNQRSHPEILAQQIEEANWPTKRPVVLGDQHGLRFRHDQRRLAEEAAKNAAYQNSVQAVSAKRKLNQTDLNDDTRRTRRKIEQGIRDAQANQKQTDAAAATSAQTAVTRQEHLRLVDEEAANLTRIIGVNTAVTDPAQVGNAIATRTTQRQQDLASKAGNLAIANAARARRGLKVIAPQPQLSDAAFAKVLNDAGKAISSGGYLDPASDAQNAKASQDAADKKLKTDIAARIAKDSATQQTTNATTKSAASGPDQQGDIDSEARRLRYQAAAFRQDTQNEKDEADRKILEEEKRRQDAEESRKEADRIRRADLATQRQIALQQKQKDDAQRQKDALQKQKDALQKQQDDAAKAAQEAARLAALAEANKTPAQKAVDAAKKTAADAGSDKFQKDLKDKADLERATRAYRGSITPPVNMNALETQRYNGAVRARDRNVRVQLDFIRAAAASANLTGDAWAREYQGYNDVNDYVLSLDYDKEIRDALPGAAIQVPRTAIVAGDAPPAGTPRPTGLNPDVPPPTMPTQPSQYATLDAQQEWDYQLLELRNAIREAVDRGLRARAQLQNIPVWQAAHKRGFWSLETMTNFHMASITPTDCPKQIGLVVPTRPTEAEKALLRAQGKPMPPEENQLLGDMWRASNQKIIDASDWEAIWAIAALKRPDTSGHGDI